MSSDKYKGCDINYINITLEECLEYYDKGIACNCDGDKKKVYFYDEG